MTKTKTEAGSKQPEQSEQKWMKARLPRKQSKKPIEDSSINLKDVSQSHRRITAMAGLIFATGLFMGIQDAANGHIGSLVIDGLMIFTGILAYNFEANSFDKYIITPIEGFFNRLERKLDDGEADK